METGYINTIIKRF